MPFSKGSVPWNKGITKTAICGWCGKEFRTYPSQKSKYCSHHCYTEAKRGKPGYWLGKRHTEEYKKDMAKSLSGKNNPRYGVKLSDELRKEIGNSIRKFYKENGTKILQKPKKNHSSTFKPGSEHWAWKGGISKENNRLRQSQKYEIWRRSVFERDDFSCRVCGKCGDVNAHHIENFADFPEARFDTDNGITFCEKCHEEFHKRYGKRGTTKAQLEEFLKGVHKKK